MTEDVFPHLYRYQFVAALAAGGPDSRPERRFLMVLSAMADHWSLVMPDSHLLASVLGVRADTVRSWLERFHDEQWLSAVPSTDLSLIHLPEGSAAYRLVRKSFEWHTRSHAPHARVRARAATTPVKRQRQDEPIPLTARALQLAAGSAGKTKRGQFAYISFIQQSLSDQHTFTEDLDSGWDRYLGAY
jgi:hypothetical protein